MMIRDSYKKGPSKIEEIINVGDIVIVNDEKIPRHLWKLGRVVALLRGKDDVLRGGNVKTGKTGVILSRSINKLYALEVRANDVPMVENNSTKTSSSRGCDCRGITYEIQ